LNCACDGRITLNELVKSMNELLGKNIEPLYTKHKPGDIKHSFANIDMIKEKLNHSPKYQFIDGLKKLINK
jgi:nucleoside-diphosphate-sugar epimerase